MGGILLPQLLLLGDPGAEGVMHLTEIPGSPGWYIRAIQGTSSTPTVRYILYVVLGFAVSFVWSHWGPESLSYGLIGNVEKLRRDDRYCGRAVWDWQAGWGVSVRLTGSVGVLRRSGK